MSRLDLLGKWNGTVYLQYDASNPNPEPRLVDEWHVALGMTATFTEDPIRLPRVTGGEFPLCDAQCLHTAGNAAGNVDDHFNFEGVAPRA